MSADTQVECNGVVVDVHPGSKFRVKLDTGQEVMTYLSGKMRSFSIKIVLGDRVTVALSPYDLTHGRITRRL